MLEIVLYIEINFGAWSRTSCTSMYSTVHGMYRWRVLYVQYIRIFLSQQLNRR